MKIFKIIVSLLIFTNLLAAQDLSKLTPEQLSMYNKYMESKSLGTISTANTTTQNSVQERLIIDSTNTNSNNLTLKNPTQYLPIFGSSLFSNYSKQNLAFEPKLNIPTPKNYILGTYDELLIDISGLYEAFYKIKVNPEGIIKIPNAGTLKVAGRTIEDVTNNIKQQLSKVYTGIGSGQTKVNISLGNIRSIRVMVVGEAVQPGTYTLPSLATAFNALYACGGPNPIGSMRDIKVIRSGKIIATLDVYSYLIDGLLTHNIALQDEDIIRIDPYKNRIFVEGAVKRNGIFECISGENLENILTFAGGFNEQADKSIISVFRITKDGKKSIDVMANKLKDFKMESGDSCYIRNLFDYKKGQSVSILGAVKKPGKYKLVENVSLKDLLLRANGFTTLALTDSIEVIRAVKDQNELLNNSTKSTVLRAGMDKDMNFLENSGNIMLEDGDQVIVRSVSGYEGVRMVRVEGEIINPGNYNIKDKSVRISDIIKKSGGLTKYAYPKGAFLIRVEQTNEIEKKLNTIVQENSKNQLEGSNTKTMDATMLRASGQNSVEGYNTLDSLQKQLSGSGVIKKISNPESVVGIRLNEILKQPGCKYDLKLEEGDIIYIPRELQTVKVIGQVLFPTLVRYDSEMCFNEYISNSGGYTKNADKFKAFVLYPNGTAKSTKHFLFFRKNPKIEPGSKIVVPDKGIEIKNKLTAGETVGILTSITATIGLLYSILSK